MKIGNNKCKCGNEDLIFSQENQTGTVFAIICKRCGRFIKWANKDEKRLLPTANKSGDAYYKIGRVVDNEN